MLPESQNLSIVPRLATEKSLLINKNNSLATSFLRRRVSWIALLPIAWLQFTIAVHQFDHVAGYVEDSCQVCVQLDRVDAAVDDAAEQAPLVSIDALSATAPAATVNRDFFRIFDSRAPPGL